MDPCGALCPRQLVLPLKHCPKDTRDFMNLINFMNFINLMNPNHLPPQPESKIPSVFSPRTMALTPIFPDRNRTRIPPFLPVNDTPASHSRIPPSRSPHPPESIYSTVSAAYSVP